MLLTGAGPTHGAVALISYPRMGGYPSRCPEPSNTASIALYESAGWAQYPPDTAPTRKLITCRFDRAERRSLVLITFAATNSPNLKGVANSKCTQASIDARFGSAAKTAA